MSVVIPAHDEAPAIGAVVERALAATPGLVEVLVVDDGSTDDTARVAESAGARVIRLPANRGKGAALRLGIAEAVGDTLVFIDADGQDDPAEIPLLLDALDAGADMVIGSRFLGTFHDGAITPLNRLGSHVLLETLNLLYGVRITDPFAGFRAVRRAALEGCVLRAERYDIEVDVLLALLQADRQVVEVPVARYRREHGASGLSSFRDGASILWRIVERRFAGAA